jgi:hypothetical protein
MLLQSIDHGDGVIGKADLAFARLVGDQPVGIAAIMAQTRPFKDQRGG